MLNKIIKQENIDRFGRWIDHAHRIVIVTHVSPDGDAIGSSLGMWHFLSILGKKVRVIVPNVFPDFLRWMPGAKDILIYDRLKEFSDQLIADADVICCLDLNTLSRLDAMGASVSASPARKIMIDHHLNPEAFCRITISHPECSSTSELVFRLICRLGYYEELNGEAAACIYTGMMTDTGGFTYNSNNRELYFIIGELLAKGIDKDEIYRNVYNTYSESRLRMMGYVLTTMQVFPEFHAALISLKRSEQKQFHYLKGDTEGFVNLPLSIKNVRFSCFLREDTEQDKIKVSLRSVGSFPCNRMSETFFNGGGHLNAAGGELYCSMAEAYDVFRRAMVHYEDLLKQ
ncbi:MAG: DHH family phosphoesterase [Prevotellaceae bacterium]|nr:DHH family phosphoesterase [Prevotellaceae bacterium]